MKYLEYQFTTINPSYSFADLESDIESLYLHMEQNPGIKSVDMALDGKHGGAMLIGTAELESNDLEAIIGNHLQRKSRKSEHYVVSALINGETVPVF